VTLLTARRVRCRICQPDPRPGIKTPSSPAAFPTSLSVPSLSPLRRSCTGLCRASGPPLRTPLSPCRSPWSAPDRYDAACERNASAGPPTHVRSTPPQRSLVGRPTVRRPLAMTLMKRLAFGEGAGDLVTRRLQMQDQRSSPSRLVHRSVTPPHVSTVDATAASRPRHHYVVPLPISPAAEFGKGSGWGEVQIAQRSGQWRKCRTLSPCPAQEWRSGSRGPAQNSY
jgi:hypothetical protein